MGQTTFTVMDKIRESLSTRFDNLRKFQVCINVFEWCIELNGIKK